MYSNVPPDKLMSASSYTAILLAAGQGSRIADETAEPKVLLDLHGRTLLERHFEAWAEMGFEHAAIVVGYKQDLIRDAVSAIDTPLDITWVDNSEYATKGNTHSMLLGLRAAPAAAAVFDADLVYDPEILLRFMNDRIGNAILVGPASIDDIEASKVLADECNRVRMTIDKRAITSEEQTQYRFAGEALGVLKFDEHMRELLVAETEAFLAEPANALLNWEHLLNRFLLKQDVACHNESSAQWIEIDTLEDLASAREKFAPERSDG